MEGEKQTRKKIMGVQGQQRETTERRQAREKVTPNQILTKGGKESSCIGRVPKDVLSLRNQRREGRGMFCIGPKSLRSKKMWGKRKLGKNDETGTPWGLVVLKKGGKSRKGPVYRRVGSYKKKRENEKKLKWSLIGVINLASSR